MIKIDCSAMDLSEKLDCLHSEGFVMIAVIPTKIECNSTRVPQENGKVAITDYRVYAYLPVGKGEVE